MTLEIRDPGFTALVGEAVECEKLADGFGFTEGPLWNAQERCLLFSDIPGNRIHRWSADAGVSVFREPSHMANGLTADRPGRLIACEHATSRVTRTEANGRITVLASHFEGKELNSPNDVVVKSDGAIYFSDPSYGRMWSGRDVSPPTIRGSCIRRRWNSLAVVLCLARHESQ